MKIYNPDPTEQLAEIVKKRLKEKKTFSECFPLMEPISEQKRKEVETMGIHVPENAMQPKPHTQECDILEF